MADYVPNTDAELVTWLTNLKIKLPTYTAALNITAVRVTQGTTWCDDLIGKIQSIEQKKNAWLAESQLKKAQQQTSVGGIRGEVALWKPQPGMTGDIEADLQTVSTGGGFGPDTFQVDITVEVFSGYAGVKFKKGETDGINLYSWLKGRSAWKFVARDTNSPYDDHTPLAMPGTPETHEYQAFGVLSDQPIGQPSDIVGCDVWGG